MNERVVAPNHPRVGRFYAPPQRPPEACPICASGNVRSIGQFYHHKELVDLYFCFDCEGVTSPFAKPRGVGTQVDWHLKVQDRNRGWAASLLDGIGIERPRVLDIGCGIGTLLECARERGGGGTGFELNAACVEYGRKSGLDLRCEYWTLDTQVPPPTLITCIMVLEHIHQPRPLLRALVEAGQKYGAPVFISVPWFTKHHWSHVSAPVDEDPQHMFRVPADHVTHFSMAGFERVARSFGATEVRLIKVGWYGMLVT